jgi:hypothetical protein
MGMGNDSDFHAGDVSVPDNATLLKAKVRLSINRLLRNYLSLLEEVADEHDEAMGKVYDALPPQYQPLIAVADHLGDTRFNAIRKRTLDAGNDSIRDLEEAINNLRV